MTARSRVNGNALVFGKDGWEYRLTGDPAMVEAPLPCPRCGTVPDADGHDGCLGHVQGAWSACCGHGVTDPYAYYHLGGNNPESSDALDLIGLLQKKRVRITRYQKGQIVFDQKLGLEMAEAYFGKVAPDLPFPKALLTGKTPIADAQNRYILGEVNITARDMDGRKVTFPPGTNIDGYDRYQRIENDAQRVYAQKMAVQVGEENPEVRRLFPPDGVMVVWLVIDDGKLKPWPENLFENTFERAECQE